MYTNVNLAAPLGVMALLGTGFLLLVTLLVLIYSLFIKRFALTKIAAVAMVVTVGIYVGVVLAFSFASGEKVLARGQEKHFCEIDCHLAYSLTEARQMKTIGASPDQATANGEFTAVTVKTRFDETTIGPHRGDGELYPNSRVLMLVDDQGRKYSPSVAAQKALEASAAAGKPLTTSLRPGESYTTTVAFDLPADAKNATLLINEGEWITHFVIGHENSLLHRKTRFQI
jgi:hypothetical protein